VTVELTSIGSSWLQPKPSLSLIFALKASAVSVDDGARDWPEDVTVSVEFIVWVKKERNVSEVVDFITCSYFGKVETTLADMITQIIIISVGLELFKKCGMRLK